MKKLFLLTITIVITFFSNLTVKAQEIDVTDDFIRWTVDNAMLRLWNQGHILKFQSGTTSDWSGGIRCTTHNDLAIGLEVNRDGVNTPSFRVYGNGWIEQNGSVIHSDSTLKTDIEPLDIHTEKLKQLKCYQYHLKSDKKNNPKPTLRYGLLAQELEKVYPDMVFTNEKNLKSINYMELIPVLIEVVKEQQAQLEAKDKQMLLINKTLFDLQKRVNSLEKEKK